MQLTLLIFTWKFFTEVSSSSASIVLSVLWPTLPTWIHWKERGDKKEWRSIYQCPIFGEKIMRRRLERGEDIISFVLSEMRCNKDKQLNLGERSRRKTREGQCFHPFNFICFLFGPDLSPEGCKDLKELARIWFLRLNILLLQFGTFLCLSYTFSF